jgi:hypothetical protein
MGSLRQAGHRFLYRPGPRAGAVATVARIGLRRIRRSNGNSSSAFVPLHAELRRDKDRPAGKAA